MIDNDLNVFEFHNRYIVINKKTNGWAILNEDEVVNFYSPIMVNNSELNERLYECGIIINNGQYVSILEENIEQNIIYFEINVTGNCNLRCNYCISNFNKNNNISAMNIDTATQFCTKVEDYINKYISSEPQIVIEFSGGEPMLNFEIIKFIIKRLSRFSSVSYVIQTNGTMINSKSIEFFKEYENVNIAISLDGINLTHNINRVDKSGQNIYERVLSNLREIHESGVKYNVVSVIHEDNIQDLEEIVCEFNKQGIKDFSLLPLLDFDPENKHKLLKSSELFAQKLWELNLNLLEKYYFNKNKTISQRDIGLCFYYLVQPNRNFMCNRNPCGAGINIVSISPTGDVYPCYGFQCMKDFLLGNINDSDFDFNDIQENQVVDILKKRRDSIKDCKECNYSTWCYGGCPSNAFLGTKDITRRKDVPHF